MLHAAEPLNKFLLSAYFLYFYAGSKSPSKVPRAMMNAACALTLSVWMAEWVGIAIETGSRQWRPGAFGLPACLAAGVK